MNKKKGKNLLIVSFVIWSISICSVIWQYIDLNFSNITQATGAITQQNYSTDADTVRYVIFIIIPLITFLISYYFLKSSKTKGLMELIKFPELKQIKSYTIFYPLILIITFIII